MQHVDTSKERFSIEIEKDGATIRERFGLTWLQTMNQAKWAIRQDAMYTWRRTLNHAGRAS
jgi:hypothetical protein